MKYRYPLFIIVFLCIINITFAQTAKEKRLSNKANRYYIDANYGKAIPAYNELLTINPNNFDYNYKLGVCYYYSYNAADKLKALPYFERALKNMTDTLPEIYYYLGRSYQIGHKFNDAIRVFETLKYYVEQSQSAIKDLDEIDNYISQCNTAIEYIKTPLPLKITNLGKNVNSESADYAPAVSADESILVFTSKREGTTGKKVDDDGKYYEDVYISRRQNTKDEWQQSSKIDTGDAKNHFFKSLFSSAEKISNAINTRDHDASISLTADGNILYLYRNSDIWKSEKKSDGKWTRPSKLPETINTKKYHEPSVSQSADGTTLYVVSERPGGFGGKDIYKSTKQADGSWGVLENLGSTVNTRFDDDSPFIHPDGKTLYFSSEGHKSMGGFDIFKTTLENGAWTTPVNIGYPINTSADDIFFVMNAKGDHAYFSSIQGENYGDLDIYIVSPEDIPNTSPNLQAYLGVDSAAARIAMIASLTNTITPTIEPAEKVNVYAVIKSNGIADNSTKIKIAEKGSTSSDDLITTTETGNKRYELSAGKSYVVTIESDNYPLHTIDLNIPENSAGKNFYQEISFEDMKEKGSVVGRNAKIYTSMLNMDSIVEASYPAELTRNEPKENLYAQWLKSVNYSVSSPLFKVTSFTDYKEMAVAVNNTNTTNKGNEPSIVAPEFKPILFDYAKSLLREEAIKELDAIYTYLAENKNAKLEIYGHTDSKGTDQYNLGLSQRRAGAAKKYFSDKGIAASRIKAIGKGESQPVAPNENPDKTDNPDGRQLNRRVEFKIVFIKK